MMNLWTKVGLPIGLGFVAAIMNMAASASKHAPCACVRVNDDVTVGEELTEEMLQRIDVSGELNALPETFVPWRERAILYGRTLPRPLKKGDLVLWRDAEPHENILPTNPGEQPMSVPLGSMTVVPEFIQVGQQVSFFVGRESRGSEPEATADEGNVAKRIGPFRVLAVGNRTTREGKGKSRNERTLTIAARITTEGSLDEQSDRLLASLKGFDGVEIMGVILHTASSQPRPARRLPAPKRS